MLISLYKVFMGILLFSILMFFSVREDLWGDEGFTVRRVEANWHQLYDPFYFRPKAGCDPFNTTYVYDFNPPLYFASIRVILGPHPNKVLIRMFSIVPMIISLILLDKWARQRYGIWTSCFLVFFFCSSPQILYYGHEARPYAMGLTWAFLLLYVYDGHQPRRPVWIMICNLIISAISIMTHFHLVWLIIVIIAMHANVFLSSHDSNHRKKHLYALSGLICGLMLSGIIIFPARHMFGMVQGQKGQALSWSVIVRTLFLPIAGKGDGSYQTFIFFITVTALIIAMAYCGKRNKPYLAPAWLFAAGAPIISHVLFSQPFYPRYSLFALPAWIMTIGYVIFSLDRMGRKFNAVIGILIMLIIVNNIWMTAPYLSKHYRSTWRPAITVFMSAEQQGDFYTVQPDWQSICFTANTITPPKSVYIFNIDEAPSCARRVWIIGSRSTEQNIIKYSKYPWQLKRMYQGDGQWLWLLIKN